MTTIAQARIAIGTSFVVISCVGTALTCLFNQSASIAVVRGTLFIAAMGCIHLAGYFLYIQQFNARPTDPAPAVVDFAFSSRYGPALRFGIMLQAFFGLFTSLMLDTGESVGAFQVALLAHWTGIVLIMIRRAKAPTTADIVFIRWGLPMLLLATGLIRRPVWDIIGESDTSGWRRLCEYLSHASTR